MLTMASINQTADYGVSAPSEAALGKIVEWVQNTYRLYIGASYTPNLTNWPTTWATGIGKLVGYGNDVYCYHPEDLLTLKTDNDPNIDGLFDCRMLVNSTSLRFKYAHIVQPPLVAGLQYLQYLYLSDTLITSYPVLTIAGPPPTQLGFSAGDRSPDDRCECEIAIDPNGWCDGFGDRGCRWRCESQLYQCDGLHKSG